MHPWQIVALAVLSIGQAGCSTLLGAGAGAAGASTAYEMQHREELKDLEVQRDRGTISQEEYQRRKDAIEDSSLIY